MKEKPVESIFMKRSKKIGVVGEGHDVPLVPATGLVQYRTVFVNFQDSALWTTGRRWRRIHRPGSTPSFSANASRMFGVASPIGSS
jgi:hypothetical protein